MKKSILLASTVLVASWPFASTQAGTLANGTWSSARCGQPPTAAALDLSNPDAYNKSIGGVTTYQKQINIYLDCIVAEGNLDIQLITKATTAAQLAAREVSERIAAQVKAANEKFVGK
jgi:hypothetical protein